MYVEKQLMLKYLFLKFRNIMTKISQQNFCKRSKIYEEEYFSEIPSHQLASLLKMDFFKIIFEDFAYLFETLFLMTTSLMTYHSFKK